MTIKVEREALLRVLQRARTNSSVLDEPISIDDEDYCLVDFRKPISSASCPVGSVPCSVSDDEDSIFTLSTTSISDSDSEELLERRVSFAEDLVTEEWTREYTPKEDIPNLFYSTEETQRFRQEYRMERKLISELSLDPDTMAVDNEELSALVASSCQQQPPLSCTAGGGRHRISRVVVLHNDKLETFFDPEECPKQPNTDASSILATTPSTDDFFDNDSFWSGSITWY